MAKVTTLSIYVRTFKGHILYNGKILWISYITWKPRVRKQMFKLWLFGLVSEGFSTYFCIDLDLTYGKDILVFYVSIWEIAFTVDFSENIGYKVRIMITLIRRW